MERWQWKGCKGKNKEKFKAKYQRVSDDARLAGLCIGCISFKSWLWRLGNATRKMNECRKERGNQDDFNAPELV
jgi:hypothetical protein